MFIHLFAIILGSTPSNATPVFPAATASNQETVTHEKKIDLSQLITHAEEKNTAEVEKLIRKKEYSKALELLKPYTSPIASYLKSKIFLKQNKIKKATEFLALAQKDPELDLLLNSLSAKIHFAAKEYDKALPLLEKEMEFPISDRALLWENWARSQIQTNPNAFLEKTRSFHKSNLQNN